MTPETLSSDLGWDDLRRERQRLGQSPGCRFVDAEEFVKLLTSRRRLVRRNVPACDVLGLFDRDTQEWFLIEEEKLQALRGELALA